MARQKNAYERKIGKFYKDMDFFQKWGHDDWVKAKQARANEQRNYDRIQAQIAADRAYDRSIRTDAQGYEERQASGRRDQAANEQAGMTDRGQQTAQAVSSSFGDLSSAAGGIFEGMTGGNQAPPPGILSTDEGKLGVLAMLGLLYYNSQKK